TCSPKWQTSRGNRARSFTAYGCSFCSRMNDLIQRQVSCMGQLPPGQVETRRFPTVGEIAPSSIRKEDWRLIVEGEVEKRLEMTLREFLALPQQSMAMDVHCVTGWSRFNTEFSGIPLADLLNGAQPKATARFVSFVAYSDRRHDTSLPLAVAQRDCWLV